MPALVERLFVFVSTRELLELIAMVGEITLGFAVGLGIGATLLALGDRVRCRLRLPVQPGVRPAVAFALGSFTVGVAVLVAGLAGLFRPAPILVLIGLAAAAGNWNAIPGLARRLRGPALAALPLLPVALAPPFFYDSWVYHLGLPWQALQDHAIRAHPGNMFSTFPPLAQLVYALPLAVSAFRAAGLIHLIGYVTAASTVSSIAGRYGASRAASFLAGAAVLYLPKVMLVPALPAAESWSLTAITASVALALTSRPMRAAAAGAGLLAGVACAARLQGLPWAILVAMIVAVRSFRLAPRTLPVFALAVLVGAAPWWAKNALLLGHPIAPMGWHLAGVDALWRDAASNLNLATGPADLLARVYAALSGTAGLAGPLLAVGIVAYFMERRFPKLLLLALGVAGLVAWSLTGALDRFLAPSIALLLAVAAASWPRRLGRACAVVTLAGVLAWGLWDARSMWSEIGGFKVAGQAETVYASTVINDPSPAFRACASLPPNARLLLVGEPRGFLLPRAFETTSQCDSSLLAPILERTAPAAAAAELRSLGFTHLLINVREMSRLGSSYPVLPWTSAEGRNRFVELTRLLGKPAVLEGSVVVYDLGEPASGPH
jgi:hypothetical protein